MSVWAALAIWYFASGAVTGVVGLLMYRRTVAEERDDEARRERARQFEENMRRVRAQS